MTGHQINSLVGDLVAMAKAMEELPQVQDALEQAKAELERSRQTVQARELAIIHYKMDIADLNDRLREAEVAKDAAETMFLEADDRTQRAVDFIKTQFGAAGSLIQALEPVRAMPEAKVEPIHYATIAGYDHPPQVVQVPDYIKEPVWQGQSESPLPSSVSSMADTSTNPVEHAEKNTSVESMPSQAEGQSEPDPTHAITVMGEAKDASAESAVTHGDDASSADDLEPQRYDDYGVSRLAWEEWAERTGYWKAPIGSMI